MFKVDAMVAESAVKGANGDPLIGRHFVGVLSFFGDEIENLERRWLFEGIFSRDLVFVRVCYDFEGFDIRVETTHDASGSSDFLKCNFGRF